MADPGGPLTGIRVIEMAGMGPAPYAAMLLSDLGAEVIRVDRPGPVAPRVEKYALSRGRRSITIDLKNDDGLVVLRRLVEGADVLIEGFRPGVAERLGLGPYVCLDLNPRLVYGRMTGWGQDGLLSSMAGHDLNYLALSGVLSLFGRNGAQPATPPGLVADFAGGGLMMAFGLVSALLSSRESGAGQVVDAAMVDGVASLTTLVHSMSAQGRWSSEPGTNVHDGGAPYYDTYGTADGGYVAVAPLKPQFYAEMVDLLGLSADDLPDRDDRSRWPELRRTLTRTFASRTRDEWADLFDGTDACVTPVLSIAEATVHPHHVARRTYVEEFGVTQPAPAPRFGRTPGGIAGPPPRPSADSREVLADWGFSPEEASRLIDSGAVESEGGAVIS